MKVLSSLVIFLAVSAHAGPGLDPASETALVQTQQLLTDPAQRAEAVKGDPNAHLIDHQVQSIAGSAQGADAIYGAAAQVMGDIVRGSGGDSQKMKQMVDSARTNPEAFFKSLSPEAQARIREASGQVRAPAQAAPRP